MSTVKEATSIKPETTEVASFLKTLFQGHIAEDLVFPFPEIPADVKETVTAFADAWTDFDARIWTPEDGCRASLPREAVKAVGELGVMGMTIPENTAAAASAPPPTPHDGTVARSTRRPPS